jgi:thiosulfate/3-mercaptopyruvate sulfurtransferase
MLVSAALFLVLTQPPQAPGMLVSTEWLAANLDRTDVVVVQIESRQQRFEEAHIAGARFLLANEIVVDGERDVGVEMPPVDSIVRVLERAGIGNDTHVVIASHGILNSARLWVTLDYIGHGGHASLLDGGMQKWRAENRPVQTGSAEAGAPGRLTARPRADMLVDADWIHARLEDPGVALVDARPDDEYTGADGGMGGMTHAGHIPGARQLFFERLLVSNDRPMLRPEAELRAMFEEGGADGSRTVVTYCMVGARASLTYFTARMLGYDVRFYDGSWHDWGTLDLPVVLGTVPR